MVKVQRGRCHDVMQCRETSKQLILHLLENKICSSPINRKRKQLCGWRCVLWICSTRRLLCCESAPIICFHNTRLELLLHSAESCRLLSRLWLEDWIHEDCQKVNFQKTCFLWHLWNCANHIVYSLTTILSSSDYLQSSGVETRVSCEVIESVAMWRLLPALVSTARTFSEVVRLIVCWRQRLWDGLWKWRSWLWWRWGRG